MSTVPTAQCTTNMYTLNKLILPFTCHYHRKCANWLTIFKKILIIHMKQRFSWKASSISAFLQTSTILWNLFTMFITIFTTAHYLSMFWARWIQLTHSVHISFRSTLAIRSRPTLGLPNGLFPSSFPSKPPVHFSSPPQAHCCTIPPSTHTFLWLHNPRSSSLHSFSTALSLAVLTSKQNKKTADGKTKHSDCTDRRHSV